MWFGKEKPAEWSLEWQEESASLTLEGETVLEYTLRWPEITGGGSGARRINRYYRRLARSWRDRWRGEVYWRACLTLAERRQASQPFVPWRGRLNAELAHRTEDLLSLRMEGEEVRGDGRPCRVRWGEAWSVQNGAPLPFRALLPGKEGRRQAVIARLTEQGQVRQAAGDLFLDSGWERAMARSLPLGDPCVTGEGVELAFPQCLFTPAAEGPPVFTLPFPPAKTGFEKNLKK